MGGSSPPPVADPGSVSAAQGAQNLGFGESQMAAGLVDQITPTGWLTVFT